MIPDRMFRFLDADRNAASASLRRVVGFSAGWSRDLPPPPLGTDYASLVVVEHDYSTRCWASAESVEALSDRYDRAFREAHEAEKAPWDTLPGHAKATESAFAAE